MILSKIRMTSFRKSAYLSLINLGGCCLQGGASACKRLSRHRHLYSFITVFDLSKRPSEGSIFVFMVFSSNLWIMNTLYHTWPNASWLIQESPDPNQRYCYIWRVQISYREKHGAVSICILFICIIRYFNFEKFFASSIHIKIFDIMDSFSIW